jgi:anti-anti-sigma regulatory factor
MPTHITQLDDPEHGKIILRIDGDMLFDDAVLLEKIVLDLDSAAESLITIDLADLDFLDSEAATVLRRMADRPKVEISGIEIFLQTSVNVAERSDG